VVVLGERHLLRLVRDYVAYYNADRPDTSLDGDSPIARSVESTSAPASLFRASEDFTIGTAGPHDERLRVFEPPQIRSSMRIISTAVDAFMCLRRPSAVFYPGSKKATVSLAEALATS
ncbi:MAG: hypothetical protein ABI461_20720, partial [Polyangiaceae bacterium]